MTILKSFWLPPKERTVNSVTSVQRLFHLPVFKRSHLRTKRKERRKSKGKERKGKERKGKERKEAGEMAQ